MKLLKLGALEGNNYKGEGYHVVLGYNSDTSQYRLLIKRLNGKPRVLGSVKEYLSSDAIDTELHKGGLIKIIKNSFVVFNEWQIYFSNIW